MYRIRIGRPSLALLGGEPSRLAKQRRKIIPSRASKAFQAAAANADWAHAPGYYLVLVNQAGKDSWPITGASFILMQRAQTKPQNAQEVLKFFDWAFKNGQKMAEELDYVALPANVVTLIEDTWKKEPKDSQGNPLWK